MWYVDAARLLLIAVFSLKAAEATTGTQLLPQNPFDLASWSLVLQNYTLTAVIAAMIVFFVFLWLIIIIKKRRESYQKVVYVEVPTPNLVRKK